MNFKKILTAGILTVSLLPSMAFADTRSDLVTNPLDLENTLQQDLVIDRNGALMDKIGKDPDIIGEYYEYDGEVDNEPPEIPEVILSERGFEQDLERFFSNFIEDDSSAEEMTGNLKFVQQENKTKKKSEVIYAYAKKSKVYRQSGYAFTTTKGDVIVLKQSGSKFYIYSRGANNVEIPRSDFDIIENIDSVKDLDKRLERAKQINTVVSFALNQLDKPYSWGASGPNSYDCSGLTSTAYRQIGMSIPRASYVQCYYGEKVKGNDLRPGDLVFFRITKTSGHVGMYLGEDKFIHAPKPGDKVKISKLSARKNIFGARRII